MIAPCGASMCDMLTLLASSVDDYLRSLSVGSSASTMTMRTQQLRDFLSITGDMPVDEINQTHVANFLAKCREDGNGESTIKAKIAALRGYFKWLDATAKRDRSLPDPMYGIKAGKPMPRNFTIVPPEDWGRLLDYAEKRFSARLRCAMALMFYHLLRESEVQRLRVGFLSGDLKRMDVWVEKTRDLKFGEPVVTELQRELRRWQRKYAKNIDGTPQPEHFLVPFTLPRHKGWKTGEPRKVDPARMSGRFGGQVGEVLADCGYPPVDEQGRSTRDGSHTMRRSGGVALYLDRVNNGVATGAALDYVSKRFHHSSLATTWGYIGGAIGDAALDEQFYDQSMWHGEQASLPENVIRLRARDDADRTGQVQPLRRGRGEAVADSRRQRTT